MVRADIDEARRARGAASDPATSCRTGTSVREAADELVLALEAVDLGVDLLRDALLVIRPYAGRCER